ncbi:MAG: sigma 54-interacting transcriptional regulator [Chrysiogenia bacterium]
MKSASFSQRFVIQGSQALDQWHDEKLSLITVENSPENLARLHKIFTFHSNFMQNIIAFIPGNFQIDILTQHFTPCCPEILQGQSAAAAETIFRQYLVFLNAAREWGMDFVNFSKFQILPGPRLRFGWELNRQNFPAPAAFLAIFNKNRHLRTFAENSYLSVLSKSNKNTVAALPSGYLYRNDDFTSNLLHCQSLGSMKSNVTIRINTNSSCQKMIIRNNLFHTLNTKEILILKIDNASTPSSDFFSALCGQKKTGKENPSEQVQEFRLFLKKSVFQKVVLLIDNLAQKEDIRFLRFLLEASDISGLITILFNDSAPFDCDLELHENPPNQLEKHFAASFPGQKKFAVNKTEKELLKKIAMIEAPVPMAIARLLAGGSGDRQITTLLKKQYLTENTIQQTLTLNVPRDITGVTLQEKKELLEMLSVKSDWHYAKLAHYITSKQWAALEQYLKIRVGESPGLVASGPAADLIIRHLPQLAPINNILAYFVEILILGNRLPLAEKVLGEWAFPDSVFSRLKTAHLAMRKKEYQKMGNLLSGLSKVPEALKEEWLYLNFYYHEKISQNKKADEYENKIKSPYYRNLSIMQLSDRSIYNRDFVKAHDQLSTALAYFETHRLCREEIGIQSQMAKLLREKGNFSEAESLYKTIYIKSEAEDLALESAFIAVDLGNLYYEKDDDFQAECWYQKALRLFEKEQNADGIMLVNSNLINILFTKGNWLEAEKLLRYILATNEKKQLLNSCAIDYLNWANLEDLRLHDDKALKLLEHASDIFKTVGNSKGLSECAFLKGKISYFSEKSLPARMIEEKCFNADQATVCKIFKQFAMASDKNLGPATLRMLNAIESKKIKFDTLRLLLKKHRKSAWLDLFKEIAWDLSQKAKNYFYYEYWYMYFDLNGDAFPGDAELREKFLAMHDFFTMNKRTISAKLNRLRLQAEENENRHALFENARLVGNYRQWRLPEDFFNSFFYEINKPVQIDWLVMTIYEKRQPLFEFSSSGLFKELAEQMLQHTLEMPENKNYTLSEIKNIFSSQEKFFYPFASTKMIRWQLGDRLLACMVLGFKDEECFFQDFSERHKETLKKFQILFRYFLQNEYRIHEKLDFIVGASEKIMQLKSMIAQVSKVDFSLLITGESGSGKELVANAVHLLSPRANQPFVSVNAAAIPETLLEAELFGYKKGAFSGAAESRIGLLEAADRGTFFLDEIADLPLLLQAKILRVLQEKEIRRLGENKTSKIDIRLISASNKDLEGLIKKNLFRADLFYRLQDLVIDIPPLRERREDIPLLIDFLLKKFGYPQQNQDKLSAISELFRNDRLPGNVRELESKIKKMITFNPELEIPGIKERELFSLKNARQAFERNLLLNTLSEQSWHKSKTAEKLGISRMALFNMLKKYKIKKCQSGC